MPLHSATGFRPVCANHCAPPLLFGRRPPQSNYPPCVVPAPDDGARLDIHEFKGGISRGAPLELAPKLPSLPPILHMTTRMPTQSYSKGARGLSVLPHEPRILTGTSISLGCCCSQPGS